MQFNVTVKQNRHYVFSVPTVVESWFDIEYYKAYVYTHLCSCRRYLRLLTTQHSFYFL
jgi:hypothetical protein